MATLVSPGGSVCEVEGDVLIASLKADGWTAEGAQPPAKRGPGRSRKTEQDK